MKDLKVIELNSKYFDDVLSLKSNFISSLDYTSLQKICDDAHHKIFILLHCDKLIGYIECSTIVPESEIYSIIINENERRKGYATFLLEWYVKFLKKELCSTIYLEVNKMNTEAINLYLKFGFIAYGERKGYYGDNDAILFKYVF